MRTHLHDRIGTAVAAAFLTAFLAAFTLAGAERARAESCPNEAARTGPSAALGDCRAYELVTPPDTLNRPLFFVSAPSGGFGTPSSSETGESVLFSLRGEALGATSATGTNDSYKAERTSSGWVSRLFGPTGEDARYVEPGGTAAAGFEYGFSKIVQPGTLPEGRYFIQPDDSLVRLGDGSLMDDSAPMGRWISPNGDHVIFTSEKQLEPEAPEETGCCTFNFWAVAANEPVDAVYEWTPSGLKVLSLLPGDAPAPPGSTTYYWGTSKDGSSVVFNVGEFFGQNGTLYVRHDGTTYPIVTVPWAEEAVYMGGSRSGDKIYYLIDEGVFFGATSGRLYEYDINTDQSRQVTGAGDVEVVNVSDDGSRVYFISGEQLDGSQGTPGAPNLYVWNGSGAKFVAELAPEDVGHDFGRTSLVAWPLAVTSAQQSANAGPGSDPSRTTADGSVLVFEAKSNLTDYDSEGHTEVYRYVAAADELTCVSCNPSGAPPASDARLQGVASVEGDEEAPTGPAAEVRNLTSDGQAVFFISSDRLVAGDTDGKLDVYEWRDGRIALISYGHSGGTDEWLYGASRDGSNVFFTSADRLVPEKESNTVSIYDVRINGGFPRSSTSVPCAVGSCQGAPSARPPVPPVGTGYDLGRRNLKPAHRRRPCRKLRGKKRKRCLRAHSHHKKNTKTTRRAG